MIAVSRFCYSESLAMPINTLQRFIPSNASGEDSMISAVQNAISNVDSQFRTDAELRVQALASPPQNFQSPLDQAMDVVESQWATDAAMKQAQLVAFRDSLDVAKSLAQNMIAMVSAPASYAAAARVLETPSPTINRVA
jgi:hypothetical protein